MYTSEQLENLLALLHAAEAESSLTRWRADTVGQSFRFVCDYPPESFVREGTVKADNLFYAFVSIGSFTLECSSSNHVLSRLLAELSEWTKQARPVSFRVIHSDHNCHLKLEAEFEPDDWSQLADTVSFLERLAAICDCAPSTVCRATNYRYQCDRCDYKTPIHRDFRVHMSDVHDIITF